MRPLDQHPYDNDGHDHSGSRFDLFFYERVGERFYLRLTPLAVALILGLTLLSIAGIVFLFYYNSGRARPMTDVNVRGADPPATTAPQNTIIIPARPTPLPPREVTSTQRAKRGEGVSPSPHSNADFKATPVTPPLRP